MSGKYLIILSMAFLVAWSLINELLVLRNFTPNEGFDVEGLKQAVEAIQDETTFEFN